MSRLGSSSAGAEELSHLSRPASSGSVRLTPEEIEAKRQRKLQRAAIRAERAARRSAREPSSSQQAEAASTPTAASTEPASPSVETPVKQPPPASPAVVEQVTATLGPFTPSPARLAAANVISSSSGAAIAAAPDTPLMEPHGSPANFGFMSPVVRRGGASQTTESASPGLLALPPPHSGATSGPKRQRTFSEVEWSGMTAEERADHQRKEARWAAEQKEVDACGRLLTVSTHALEFLPQVKKVVAARIVQQTTINEEDESSEEAARARPTADGEEKENNRPAPRRSPSRLLSTTRAHLREVSAVATLPLVKTFTLQNDSACDLCVLLVPESACFQVQTPMPAYLKWHQSLEISVALVELPLAAPLEPATFQLKIRSKRCTESQMAAYDPVSFWNATKRRPYARKFLPLEYGPTERSIDAKTRQKEAEKRREMLAAAVQQDEQRSHALLSDERARRQTEARKARHILELEAIAKLEAERVADDEQAREDHQRMEASTHAWLTKEATARDAALRARKAHALARRSRPAFDVDAAQQAAADEPAPEVEIDHNLSIAWAEENADAFRPLSPTSHKQTPLWGLAATVLPRGKIDADAAETDWSEPIEPVEPEPTSPSAALAARRSAHTRSKTGLPFRSAAQARRMTAGVGGLARAEAEEKESLDPATSAPAAPTTDPDAPVPWNDVAFVYSKNARGAVDSLYHFLSSLRAPANDLPALDGILMPDTIVFRSGVPAAYFYSGSNCEVREKAWGKISTAKAIKRFDPTLLHGKFAEQGFEHSIVGTLLASPPVDAHTRPTEYMPFEEVSSLLSGTRAIEGNFVLQQFMRPPGMHHEQFKAEWSTAGFTLKRRAHLRTYTDLAVAPAMRLVHFDAPVDDTMTEDVITSGALHRKFLRVCEQVVAHLAVHATPQQLRPVKLSIVFQRGASDTWYMLYADKVNYASIFGEAQGALETELPAPTQNLSPYAAPVPGVPSVTPPPARAPVLRQRSPSPTRATPARKTDSPSPAPTRTHLRTGSDAPPSGSCVKCHDPAHDTLPLSTVLQHWQSNIYFSSPDELVSVVGGGRWHDEFWSQKKMVSLCENCFGEVNLLVKRAQNRDAAAAAASRPTGSTFAAPTASRLAKMTTNARAAQMMFMPHFTPTES